MLKNLVKNLKPSSTLLINETSKKLEDQGKKIYKFGFGQSPFPIPESVVMALKNNANKHNYLITLSEDCIDRSIYGFENPRF